VRLDVTLGAKGRLTLPIHHNHLVQAAVYRLIEEPTLAEYLHSHGFVWRDRRFKLFTFSRLLGESHFEKEREIIVFSPPVRLVITSPVAFLVKELGKGLLRRGYMRIGSTWLEIAGIASGEQVVRKQEIRVQMLSPLTVYSTLDKPSGRYTYYYSPFEERFSVLVGLNLAKKYEILYGRAFSGAEPVKISAEKITPNDFKVLKYKNTVVKGWLGRFRLKGDPEMLTLALEAGLGAKNSQGFGCCEEI